MNDVQQVALQQGYIDRVVGAISDQAITVALVALAGMVIGIATVQIVKLGIRVFRGDSTTEAARVQRALLYRFCGVVAGFLWTAGLEWSILSGHGTFAIATGAGIVAGGFTPSAYDLWHNRVFPWISGKFGRKSAPPSDADPGDETTTRMRR